MQLRQVVRLYGGFSDPTRLRILNLLEGSPGLRVNEITTTLQLPQSTVSRQLSLLRSSGVVEDQRDGRFVHYYLAEGPLMEDEFLPATLRRARAACPELKVDLRRLNLVLRGKVA
jgi:ArsR family transcriptional regulator, arsenate/arsenite/antimonite-responsive transcriptional repressor